MLRMMKYVDDTSDRGLDLNPMRKWDGNKKHEFIISGRSDSDYAKDTQTRKSISGYKVLLEGAVIGHGNKIRYSYKFVSYISYYVNSYKAHLAKARRWSKR
jgi:hypothetical protein